MNSNLNNPANVPPAVLAFRAARREGDAFIATAKAAIEEERFVALLAAATKVATTGRGATRSGLLVYFFFFGLLGNSSRSMYQFR